MSFLNVDDYFFWPKVYDFTVKGGGEEVRSHKSVTGENGRL